MQMKKLLSAILAAFLCLAGTTAVSAAIPGPQAKQDTSMKIISDKVVDGVRYVSATPSSKVCSKQIDIQINVKDHVIRNAKFTQGCPGNAEGLCKLLKGMKAEDAVTKLEGINCSGRGTSCPDQLAAVLKALKW